MQYNCLYRQVTYLNRIINLTITKWTTEIKKQKDANITYATYASIDYVIYLNF